MKSNLIRNMGMLFFAAMLTFGLVGPQPVTVYALGVPTLLTPADGAVSTAEPGDHPPLGIPQFQWTAVAGATSYRLQISGDIAFTSLIVNIATPNTVYTPTSTSTFADGVWYWRVRADAPTPVGQYSGIHSFTKDWSSPGNAPVLSSPDDGATLDFYDNTNPSFTTPIFSWGPVMGAARYKLRIFSSSGGCLSAADTAVTLTTSYQPPVKQSGTVLYWCVIPVDLGGHNGTPSVERWFNNEYSPVLTLLSPDPNVVTYPTFTPTFRWTAVRGASVYHLQYSTTSDFTSGITTSIDTRNTSYTPTAALANDQDYWWRVRPQSGTASLPDWTTAAQKFRKQWYIKPVNLTPTNNFQDVRFPMFSWTPVPGAARYEITVSHTPNQGSVYNTGESINPFYTPKVYNGASSINYWRVTPFDGSGHAGQPSDETSYVSYQGSVAPEQVYPLDYYPPDSYTGFPGVTTNPHEDRTVASPVFLWHRLYQPYGLGNQGDIVTDLYRLQVSTDPTFTTVDWTVDTQNTVATPNSGNPFTPTPDTDYYWRVCPLSAGSCPVVPSVLPPYTTHDLWSQIWTTRFNPALALTATSGAAPVLLRPTEGSESVEATPLLEWFPLNGASAYDVQVSTESDFGSLVDSATVSDPDYAPTLSFAQRSLGAVDFGVYYWRVRQSPSGTWSAARRFQIASQSQWQVTRTLGNVSNQLQIGSDGSSDVSDPDYDLTDLQAAQDVNSWFFGFHVPSAPTKNVTYALFLDTDHVAGSGATSAPVAPGSIVFNMSTITAFRPEYAVYVVQSGGVFAANQVFVYHWSGSAWGTVSVLNNIGGSINYSAGYVEVQLPNTAIGYQSTTGSYAVSLLSLPATGGLPQDSVPSDENVPGAGAISHFSSVSERMNLLYPTNMAGLDPTTYSSILPFYWDYPYKAPWAGAVMSAYLDANYTNLVTTFTLTSTGAYYVEPYYAWGDDFDGNNTYYWRIQPRYLVGGIAYFGVWSDPGWRFVRQGFVPRNLQTSVTFATPTFSWDMVEGAESYDLQVNTDSSFGASTMVLSALTRLPSYTDAGTLANGTYYWHVRARRNGGILDNWAPYQTFTLALPLPDGLTPANGATVPGAPTLCWQPLVKNDDLTATPVLAAWKYFVQVSKDPTFSAIYDNIDTEQSCWTPSKGYADGQYYWRMAMEDGQGKRSAYTPNHTFTKQYPTSALIAPLNGAATTSTPTFIWTPVAGASTYKMDVSTVNTFSPIFDSVTTGNTRFTPTKKYTPGTVYYWRVAVVDYNGNIGPYTNATIILNGKTKTFLSAAASDGWVLESAKSSGIGGAINSTATTFILGDDALKRQYRAILSFNTAALTAKAHIISATLKISKIGMKGTNPFMIFGKLRTDIRTGPFSGSTALQPGDFNYAASGVNVGSAFSFSSPWYSAVLNATGLAKINKTSTTQIRLYFTTRTNNNTLADYMTFASGSATTTLRPQLVITYYIP